MLHLHRLQHDQLAACTELAACWGNLDHRPGQLGTQRLLTRVQLDRRNPRVVLVNQRGASQLRKFLVEKTGRDPTRLEHAVGQQLSQ